MHQVMGLAVCSNYSSVTPSRRCAATKARAPCSQGAPSSRQYPGAPFQLVTINPRQEYCQPISIAPAIGLAQLCSPLRRSLRQQAFPPRRAWSLRPHTILIVGRHLTYTHPSARGVGPSEPMSQTTRRRRYAKRSTQFSRWSRSAARGSLSGGAV